MSGEGYPGGYAVTGAGGAGGAAISAGANSQNTGTVIFSNSNGVSFGLNAGTLTASAAAGAGIAISDSAGSQGTGTVIFSNANGVSFGLNAGTMTATVQTNYLTTADLSANSSKYIQNWKLTGNTAGTTSSAEGTDLWFSGGNSITVSGSSNSVVFSVGNYITTAALSGDSSKYVQNWKLTGNTAGTTSSAEGSDFWISGGNAITVSGSSNSIVFSVANGGAFTDGVSNLGNTAGSTGTVSNRIVLVGSRGITLSQSTGGASSATVSIVGPRLSQFYPFQGSHSQTQKGQGTFCVNPVQIPTELVFDLFAIPLNFSNATNSSGNGSISFWVGVYTSNVSTLSVLHSTSHTSEFTMSGTVGSYSLFAGMRRYGIPWTTTIQPGDYWVGLGSSTNTAVADMSISQYVRVQQASNVSGAFGFASNLTRGMTWGGGLLSVQTNAVPNSFGFTDLSVTNLHNQEPVMFYFLSNTF